MTWLLGVVAPVASLAAIWWWAVKQEEKWERELDDEEWEE